VLAVTRFRFGTEEELPAAARALLTGLAAQPGFVGAALGRALDDPQLWVLTTRWAAVGAYRRALSAYDVKLAFAPLMGHVVDEPGGYEVVAEAGARPGPAAE
jgi:quinol monooxygenase YgiN